VLADLVKQEIARAVNANIRTIEQGLGKLIINSNMERVLTLQL
jgi:hypothetical protein